MSWYLIHYRYLSHDTTLPVTPSFSILHYQWWYNNYRWLCDIITGWLFNRFNFLRKKWAPTDLILKVSESPVNPQNPWVGGPFWGKHQWLCRQLYIYIYTQISSLVVNSQTQTLFCCGYISLSATWLILVVVHFQGETVLLIYHLLI